MNVECTNSGGSEISVGDGNLLLGEGIVERESRNLTSGVDVLGCRTSWDSHTSRVVEVCSAARKTEDFVVVRLTLGQSDTIRNGFVACESARVGLSEGSSFFDFVDLDHGCRVSA